MKKIINYVAFALSTLLMFSSVSADFLDCGNYSGGYGMMGYGSGYGFMFFLLFLGIIIALVAILFRHLNENKTNQNKDDILEILKKRLASGEITEDEYDLKKKKLLEK